MSDEMALSDNVSGEDAKVNGDEAAAAGAVEAAAAPAEVPADTEQPPTEGLPVAELAKDETDAPMDNDTKTIEKEDQLIIDIKPEPEAESEPVAERVSNPDAVEDQAAAAGDGQGMDLDDVDDKRGIKRRASEAFSDNGDEFVGFDEVKPNDLSGYNKVVERLEAEVTAATKEFTPVRNVMGTPTAPVRASKRPRQDTDGSRPSSALSSRSDGDAAVTNDTASVVSSPVQRGGRRATTEMSSPLLRAPLERGWRRELVYRAALDAHSRRNADIYYYSPQGKKLRSTREVAEHLAGTGLTLENFSFFKEPLGVDDPEKEIIRDAKLMRRVESPVAAAAPPGGAEGKRTPKPKQPKGASPDPPAVTPKSPPARIKVKSMGSRLSGSAPAAAPAPAPARQPKKPPLADNNNSAAWRKPRPPHAPAPPAPQPAPAPAPASAPASAPAPAPASAPAPLQPAPAPAPAPAPPPPLQSRPPVLHAETDQSRVAPGRQLVQPCSLTCGRGVPSLACASCLCLYHPACAAHYRDGPQPFYCRNCRSSSSPPSSPPPLTHKSGAPGAAPPHARRAPAAAPAPRHVRPEKRVLLRMKAAQGGPEGERVWAVSQAGGAAAPPAQAQAQAPAPAAPPTQLAIPVGAVTASGGLSVTLKGGARLCLPQALPQSLARLNGRRYIVVPRSLLHHAHHEIPADD